ncbi:MAG: hypothetical protein ACQEUZ_14625 [Pseudomonadota bacterium]
MTESAEKHPEHYISVPEAVAVFDDAQNLQDAIYDLNIAGFNRHDISLLAREEVLEKKLGRTYWKARELEDNPDAPRASFVSEEWIGELEGYVGGGFFFIGSYIALAAIASPVAALGASIAAVALGGGAAGALGTLLARRIGKHHRDYYQNQVDHGGILLWVRVRDDERRRIAEEILKGHGAKDVHVHDWSEP